jgi:predicted O-methyltransferase YrrM
MTESLRHELGEALSGVPGWFEDDEAWALHEVVRNHPASGVSGPTVVEIGSWYGRSTIVIARALQARGGGLVYAIDPHSGTAIHEAEGVLDTYQAFLENVREAGVAEYVRPIRALSTMGRSQFAARSVDVLLVDGAHEYDDVIRDIDDWSSALADVATVAFHDARTEESVARAISDRVLDDGSPFSNPRLIDETCLVDFRRETD